MSNVLRDALSLDLEAKAAELAAALRVAVLQRLRRRGVIVAVSGVFLMMPSSVSSAAASLLNC